MADVVIDPFGNCDKTDSHPDEAGETIPLNPGGGAMGGSIWEPESEQEMSFRGMSLMMKVLREHVKVLYQKLSESISQNPEKFHYDYFKIRKGRLYYEDMNMPLRTKDGMLRSASEIADILGKSRLRKLGSDIPSGKVTA